MADCGNTASAVVQGQWQYIATISYTNAPTQHFGLAPGTRPAELMSLSSACAGPSQCSLLVGSATSPSRPLADPNQALYTDGSTTLTQSGSDYTGVYPSGGYGGPNLPTCRPPSLAFHMSIHVGGAVSDSSGGWRASYLSGSEVSTEQVAAPA